MKYSEAVKLRQLIVKSAQSLTDTEGLEGVALFPTWKAGVAVTLGQRYQYSGKLYKVVQNHTTQSDWTPDVVPALFTEVVPEGVIPAWKQPTGAQDAYNIGDKVMYNGQVWVSKINANTTVPDGDVPYNRYWEPE